MRNFFFPVQDASIFSEEPQRNTGYDEILEVGKTNDGHFIVRSLLQFDTPTTVPPQAKFDLVLYVANASRLSAHQGVEICQVSQSWTEGTGYFYQQVISSGDGVTWTQNSSGSSWPSGSQGGSLLNAKASASCARDIESLTFDVTQIVRDWISGSVVNNGVAVRFPTASEADIGNKGNIKVFSAQTHTIYRPVLVAKWDDSVYTTGSQTWPTSSLLVIPIAECNYRVGETVRVDLSVRERYPLKSFVAAHTAFVGDHYLPTSSYYSIVDEQSGVTVIPFSSESVVSSNGNQSYFTFKVENMYPRRYYRVLVKVVHDGVTEIFDQNVIFTIR